MSSVEIIEDIASAFIQSDNKKIISILEGEIEKRKKMGQNIVSRRLRNLLSKIPDKKAYSFQSVKNDHQIYSSKNESLVEYIESKILLEEVVLDIENQKKIKNFLIEWENRIKLSDFGISPTNKLLIYGPPGTGKTKLAYGLANKLNLPLVLVRLDELISSYLGKTGKNIKDIFDIAKKQEVLIFLDEIDTIAKDRADEKELGELKRIVTVLLQNIDSFPQNSIIIGATNHEGLLDTAIWRRFPLRISLGVPSKPARKQLIKLFIDKFRHKLDFELLADLTEGLSGSAISDIVIHMKKRAILEKIEIIDNTFALKNILDFSSKPLIEKKQSYKVCQLLKDKGYSIKEISDITSMPYTTLRDNIK
ncbi:MAG: ATP-binding protein [Patescibacteria group bacterium]|jgi:AAA+ superfamily predicted ATPase